MEKAKEIFNNVTSSVTTALTVEAPRNDQHGILDQSGDLMKTNFGTAVPDDRNTLKAGPRGPSLLEDFWFREKMTHFDHERMPERVVHARGSAAHGYFQCYKPLAEYTCAQFLNDTTTKVPVFVRFSTVSGSKGSKDTARDVRGFAVRFYTKEGNFDMVGNNMPVFFVQDALKFVDIIHAAKPEPHNGMPQAGTAHDNFWDFVSLQTETTHMIMWAMSDRAIPRSYTMMEGFGVHSFRLVNAQGKSRFVKFHWKPAAGIHSLTWDEAEKLGGKNSDFHREDLYQAIEDGNFPEWELGFQIVEEEDQLKYGFDLLDATKLIPEELVPVQLVGKLVLNRNPDNFFAETEQVAFCTSHLVPGIDFSEDPLLQGRNFSYLDTQINRFGTPNFYQIPINQPINSRARNNEQDGQMRIENIKGRVNYEPSSLGGCPFSAAMQGKRFTTFPTPISGTKIRVRSESFNEHFSQATLFYNSMSEHEKRHIADALKFELSSIETQHIKDKVVDNLNHVDHQLAVSVAQVIGAKVPTAEVAPNNGKKSPALSQLKKLPTNLKGRKIAFIVSAAGDAAEANAVKKAIEGAQGRVEIISNVIGPVGTDELNPEWNGWKAEWNFQTASSVFFDGVYVVGDKSSTSQFSNNGKVIVFLAESYKHCKTIAVGGGAAGKELLAKAEIPDGVQASQNHLDDGVVTGTNGEAMGRLFVEGLLKHRHWARETTEAWYRVAV